MIDPGMVLEKIVVNTGGLRPSYLGRRRALRIDDLRFAICDFVLYIIRHRRGKT
jgi:hypothetical protein